MTAARSSILRVDSSLARIQRTDRVTDGALVAAVAFCLLAFVLAGVLISQSITRKTDRVGVQWP